MRSTFSTPERFVHLYIYDQGELVMDESMVKADSAPVVEHYERQGYEVRVESE
jgi:hypothetical protein